MKCLHSAILSLLILAAPAVAQNSTLATCPCDFSSQAFSRLLGNFTEGSVSCYMQSGVRVKSADGKQQVINALSTRVLVMNKQSYTPGGWLLEYYSSEYAPPMGMGSYCADSMGAAIKQTQRKDIKTFGEYQACLRDLIAAVKTVRVYCNQAEAMLPDPPKNAKPAPSSNSLQDILNAVPLNPIPLQQMQPRSQ